MTTNRLPSHHCHIILGLLTDHFLKKLTTAARSVLQTNDFLINRYQRWSPRERPWPRGRPREHILKSLALALASKPQVLENCPFLGWRIALFLEPLKFSRKTPETSRKICEDLFFPHLEIS